MRIEDSKPSGDSRHLQTVMRLIMLFLPVLVFSGCGSTEPAVIGIPDYTPDRRERVSLELPEPEVELPEIPQPRPEDPTPEKEPEREVRYRIDPPEGYNSESSYLRVSFVPAETGDSRRPGGTISVHIGHREIEGANTKWYSYTLSLDGKKYTRAGRVSVPFVRGRENYWWNEEVLQLPQPLKKKVTLTVTDEYGDTQHRFTITKEFGN